ncbi:MAG: hypothetical protein ACXWU2_03970 [Allosphingosinicella sp.]
MIRSPARAMTVAAAWYLFWPSGAAAQSSVEELFANPWFRTGEPVCGTGAAPDEITVCGRRDDPDRYRLPFRDEESSVSGRGPLLGEVPGASAEATPYASCGIFEGERRCSKRELRDYGYYDGRDPITAVRTVLEAVTKPE